MVGTQQHYAMFAERKLNLTFKVQALAFKHSTKKASKNPDNQEKMSQPNVQLVVCTVRALVMPGLSSPVAR